MPPSSSSSSFSFPAPADLQLAIARCTREITATGGECVGDTSSGRFTGITPLGRVVGSYLVADGQVTVTIDSKPFLIPAQTLETRIRSYFGV